MSDNFYKKIDNTALLPEEKKSTSGKRAVLSMAIGTTISRILGFIKLGLTLLILGSSTDISDSFAFANQAPNMLYILIGGGALNSILVPQIIKASCKKDKGKEYVNKLLTIVILFSSIITVLFILLSPIIVSFFGSEWNLNRQKISLTFLLWCLPQIFFYVLYTVLGQILNARSIFQPYVWAPIFNNIIAIIGLIIFIYVFGVVDKNINTIDVWTNSKTILFLGSTTLGVIIQACILVFPIKKCGYQFSLSLKFRGMGFRDTARVAFWAIALVFMNQLAYLVIFWVSVNAANSRHTNYENPSAIAGNAAYDAASILITFPHSIIAVSIATLMFTRISNYANSGQISKIIECLSYSQRIIALMTFFAFSFFVVLSGQIGMFLGGENKISGHTMGLVILSLCANIPLMSINFIFQRIFYALNDSRTPFMIQIPSTFLCILLAFCASLLPSRWIIFGLGVNGIFSFSLSIWLNIKMICKHLNSVDGSKIIRTFIRIGIASIFSGIIGSVTLYLLGGYDMNAFPWSGRVEALITCIPVTLIMIISYFMILKIIKLEELKDLLKYKNFLLK